MNIPPKYWEGKPLFDAGLPWLTPGAIRVLQNIVLPSFHVLEFGGGGSTRFFARRCKRVFTWEADERWLRTLKLLVTSPGFTITDDIEWVWALDERFDIVLLDNSDRAANRQYLSQQALRFVKPNGWFILDNYGRYKLSFLAGWNVYRYDDPHWSGNGTLLAKYY